MIKKNQVQKSLSPEEKSVLANVRSLLDQLEQMEEAEAGMGPAEPGAEVEMAAMTDGLPEGDEEGEELEEGKVEKSEVATDGAEERIDELPVDDEEALKVLKAIMGLGSRAAPAVRKSAVPARDGADREVQARTLKVLKSIQRRLDEQGEAISGILEGFGVADHVLAVQKSRRPVNPAQPSAQAVLKALTDALGGARVEKSAPAEPEGGLRDVLSALYQ